MSIKVNSSDRNAYWITDLLYFYKHMVFFGVMNPL